MTAAATAGGLRGSAQPLVQVYDVALLDLDGVVYLGGEPVPGAADALERVRAQGMRLAFVTNNAARTPEDVADRLRALGVPARGDEVVTSAQAAATLLADRLGPGDPVLVVGGGGLRRAVAEAGLRVVSRAEDAPVAVAQGYSRDIGYAELAEAALALRAGAYWVASNGDTTIPTTRGLLPGNGALVAALVAATGRHPVVAGKPELPLHAEAVRRSGARTPLVVGDRLDTDIEGAARAGTDSLLVLTGVSRPADLLAAPPATRPTYLAPGLDGLLRPHPPVEPVEGGAACGGWRAVRVGDRLRLDRYADPRGGEDGLDPLRALCAAAWAAEATPREVEGPDELLKRLDLRSR